MPKILNIFQKQVLREIGKSALASHFVWSGGTALAYCYLLHRKSVDLDFLSQDLVPADYLLGQIKTIAEKLNVKKIEEQRKFNRHEFWLKRIKEILKVEFVFYPFPKIKKLSVLEEFDIKIDSIEDILTNKAHAVFERAEPKDVFDIYCIFKKTKIKIPLIFKWVEKKFGVQIDPVLWTSTVLQGAERLKEIKPLIFKREFYNAGKIKEYFEQQAQNYLRRKIK